MPLGHNDLRIERQILRGLVRIYPLIPSEPDTTVLVRPRRECYIYTLLEGGGAACARPRAARGCDERGAACRRELEQTIGVPVGYIHGQIVATRRGGVVLVDPVQRHSTS